MANVKYIDETEIATPTKFDISHFNITKATRTADGTMVMDLIARKMKFTFKYDYIIGTSLDLILSLIHEGDLFFDLTFIKNNTEYTKTVYVGEIKYTEGFTQTGQEVYKDLEFNLIEQ